MSNSINKQHFINLRGDKFQGIGCKVHNAKADADGLIVRTAVGSAETMNTVVIGDDNEFLVLLCYHADMDSYDIFFKPEPKKNLKKNRVWNIKMAKAKLEAEVRNKLLFVHAILGCDTTSQVFSIGKGIALKKLKTSSDFRDQVAVFHRALGANSKDYIIAADEKGRSELVQ